MKQHILSILLLISIAFIAVVVFTSTNIFEQTNLTSKKEAMTNLDTKRTVTVAKPLNSELMKMSEPVESIVDNSSDVSSTEITQQEPVPEVAYTGYMQLDGAYQAMIEMVDINGELLANTVSIGDVLFETQWEIVDINQYTLEIVNNGQQAQIGLAGSPSLSKTSSAKAKPRSGPVIDPVDGMIHDPAYGLIDPNNPDPDDELVVAPPESESSAQNPGETKPMPAVDIQALLSGNSSNNAAFKQFDFEPIAGRKQPTPFDIESIIGQKQPLPERLGIE